MIDSSESKCAVCSIESHLICTGCRDVFYCCKEHQKLHWRNGHKNDCKNYVIVSNDELGRYMRATRDIKPGEIIISEAPLLVGPKITSPPVCLSCLKLLTPTFSASPNYYKCTRCKWPMCGPLCQQSLAHKDECDFMSARKYHAKINYDSAKAEQSTLEPAYCVIMPLRCYLLRKKDSAAYKRFASLEDHLNERLDSPLYNVLRANLVTFMKSVLRIADWDEMDILRTAAILDTNAFDVRLKASNLKFRAIYPMAGMISHDCTPNTRHVFDKNMNILFVAKLPINKGQIISTSYTNVLKCTLIRRTHLEQAKCFACTCRRCSDPTEFLTYAGSIMCERCKIGKLISTNPLDNTASWKCQLCPHTRDAQYMINIYSAINTEIKQLDKSSPSDFEKFIYAHREMLHEKNAQILQVKYALTRLYGSVHGFQMDELTDEALIRKIELITELLDVADIIDSGMSDFRGHLLLDLFRALRLQEARLRGTGLNGGTELNLQRIAEILKEATTIFKHDPIQMDIIQRETELISKDMHADTNSKNL